jgi:hypothetical protein
MKLGRAVGKATWLRSDNDMHTAARGRNAGGHGRCTLNAPARLGLNESAGEKWPAGRAKSSRVALLRWAGLISVSNYLPNIQILFQSSSLKNPKHKFPDAQQ